MLATPSRSHHRPSLRVGALALLFAVAALPTASQAELAAEVVATGLDQPLFAASPPGDGRLFIVERAGQIRILLNGELLEPPFLDIRPLVSRLVSERGLLGLAFDPAFPHNGVFYVYYTDLSGDSVLARYQVGDDPDRADPASGEILMVIEQPFANHNGGTIAFGADGMLYWGPGDGGRGNDPGERSQDPTTLLGKMLRLDVSDGPGHPVAIPEDNPFVDDPGILDEIWAFGLRNPYRFSFDRETGDLWIADVGQDRREEVNFEPADDPGGRNYGWDVMEGSLCNDRDPAPAPPCNDPSLTLPVTEYGHAFGLCSVTGGYVYRGPIPSLQGQYVFGDYCRGLIFVYDPATGDRIAITDELAPASKTGFALVGFGEDGDGDLHVVHDRTGTVYRIRSALPACSDGFDNDGDGLADDEDPACLDPEQDEELPRNDLAVVVFPHQIRLAPLSRVVATLLGSEAIDLSRADPETLGFGPEGAAPGNPHAPFRLDLNHDGFEDWLVPFRAAETGLAIGDSEACLSVEVARVPFETCVAVEVKPRWFFPWWWWWLR